MGVLSDASMHDGQDLAAYRLRGDQEALTRVIARHAGLVQQVGLRLTGNAADADDVAQAVFLTLVRKAASLEDRAGLAPWLHRVASNAAARVLRSRARRRRHEARGATMDAASAPAPDSERQARAEHLHGPLHAAVAALPDPYRSAVVMHYFQGLSQAQAAASLGRAEKSFSVLLGRAREKLRRALGGRTAGLGLAGLAGVLASARAPAAEAALASRYAAIATGSLPASAQAGALAGGLTAASGLALPPLALAAAGALLSGLAGGGIWWSLDAPDAAPIVNDDSVPILGSVPIAVRELRESSGLALSGRDPELCWTHNDLHNAPLLFGCSRQGGHRATLRLPRATQGDWEDLAAFTHRGRPCLAIGDIGDNEARGGERRIHLIEEPALAAAAAPAVLDAVLLATVRFRYPGAAQDANALAFDPSDGCLLILSEGSAKADARAWRLRWDGSAAPAGQTAEDPGPVMKGPVRGACISADGRRCHVLAPGRLASFARAAGETWTAAFARAPQVSPLTGGAAGAQGVAELAPGRLLLSAEGSPARLWTLDPGGNP